MRLMVGKASAAELERLGRAFARRHMASSGELPGIARLLREDQAAGHTVALATAAFDFYARCFAARFGIAHVIATPWDGAAGAIANCYGVEKHRRVQAWLIAEGLRREDIRLRFVSDSFADAPLLDMADEAIFVIRSASKRRRAEARGWRVVSGD